MAFGEFQFDEKLYVYLPAALMPNASYGFQLFIKLGIGMFENWPTAIATKVAKNNEPHDYNGRLEMSKALFESLFI